MRVALDIVVREYEWSVWRGCWVVVYARVIKANPEERWRSK